jgi:hypothetical protein
MRKHVRALACVALLGASGYASALDIGGLQLTPGTNTTSEVLKVASVYENVITAVGQELRGFGEVTQSHGDPITALCAGCELTYTFGGYTVTSLTPTDITFSGGWVNFYLGFGADNDFNPFASGSSAADLTAAQNGTLFLTLSGHDIGALGNTFIGHGNNIGLPNAVGNGAGLLDVDFTGTANGNTAGAGAIANAFFDTNTVAALFGGNADLQVGSSFSNVLLPHPNECPGGPACLAGSADLRGVVAIPEPETYALMLAGLGAMGFVARRRRR